MGRKPNLSNWIQYLVSIRSMGTAIQVGMIAAKLVLISFIINSLLNYELKITSLCVFVFLLLLNLWLSTSINSPLEKSRKILRKIMKGEMTVPEIEKEWFGVEKMNIKQITYLFIKNYGYYVASVLLISGTLFVILSFSRQQLGIEFISENLLLTIGSSLFSVGIAIMSIKIAVVSDFVINNIANANFLSVLSKFEDRRLDLQLPRYPEERKYVNVIIWKAMVDLNEMKELLEFCEIKKEHQERMVNLHAQFFGLILNSTVGEQRVPLKNILSCEAVAHLLQMSKKVFELKLEAHRQELYDDIKNLFNEQLGTIIDDIYIEESLEIIKDMINQREPVENFIERLEDIKTRARPLIEAERREQANGEQ
jgi:hypothetical protein